MSNAECGVTRYAMWTDRDPVLGITVVPLAETNGHWVRYSDYAALDARVKALEGALQDMLNVADQLADQQAIHDDWWVRQSDAAHVILTPTHQQPPASCVAPDGDET